LLRSLADISNDMKITKTQSFNLRHSKFRMPKNYFVTYQAQLKTAARWRYCAEKPARGILGRQTIYLTKRNIHFALCLMVVPRMKLVCSKCWEMQASSKVNNRKLLDKVVLYNISALNIGFYAARIHIIFYPCMFHPLQPSLRRKFSNIEIEIT